MPAPSTYFKVLGDHKLINSVKLKRAGAWGDISKIYTKVSGAWKLVYEKITTPFTGPQVASFGHKTHSAVFAEGSAMTLLGASFAWGDNEMARLDIVDGDLTTTMVPYTGVLFPWGPRGGHIDLADPFSGEALCAARNNGLLVMQNYQGFATSFDSDGNEIDTSIWPVGSNIISSTDGHVYYVLQGGLGQRTLYRTLSDGTAESLYPEGNISFSDDPYWHIFSSGTSNIYVYLPTSGLLMTVDPENNGGSVGDGIIASTTIDTDYTSLATAGDGSIFGLKVGTPAFTQPTRIYRNDVLVFTGANNPGFAVNIMRNWTTGGICWMDTNKLYEISADGVTVVSQTLDTAFTEIFNQVNTHPAFPGTLVGSSTNTTASNPPFLAVMFQQ